MRSRPILKKYPAKISKGLLVFICLAILLPIVPIALEGFFNFNVVFKIVLLVVILAFVLHLFLKTEYVIDGDKLKIRAGFFSYKPIRIADINAISKTKSLLASPAPSFDRIEIKHGKFDSIIISPKDKHTFAKGLVGINPKIKNNISEKRV